MSKELVRKVHANDKQIKFLRSRAKRKSFIGGRGSGKSTVMGMAVGILFNHFPKATWAMVGLTYVQLDLIVIPSIRDALGMMGLTEFNAKINPSGTYVIGVKPPDHWVSPYKKVGRLGYQYCITFINGFTLRLISQDRPETHRGLNLDGFLVDESATMNPDFIKKVIQPAVRANKYAKFASHPWHHGFFDFSSASWSQEGMWIYEVEERWMQMLEERATLSHDQLQEVPPQYLFLESTFKDNQEVLPDDYEQRLSQELEPLEFEVEVLNFRLGKLPNGFYHGFSSAKHCYSKSYTYQDDDKTGLVLFRSNDYLSDMPLDLSLDFNSDIVWGIVGQEIGKELRVINSKYVKPTGSKEDQDTSIIEQLGAWFCDTYESNEVKDVYVYGDPGGRSTSAATSYKNRPFYNILCDVLHKRGWRVFRRELTHYPNHQEKYTLINLLLEENNPRAPKLRFNQNTNKVLVINIQQTPVTTDKTFKKGKGNTAKKDKASETRARNREYATDGTDALDYWLWVKCKKYLNMQRRQRNFIHSR
ncbi:hypothetical protein [Arundinibacter roseus]|uniref:Phage terminase large subunit N-terminal domain-containing protein n=1 Tax=Arundinibacter roseus TaxID=2070510 RepID=A0A4R4JZ94_9BACT|nr:hypothetical protein [Arundinibacter roseus]TDB60103.1 hypothetical protein EZE20_21775 [Arundinibacter roseus]